MTTFNDGESGSSVRTKINAAINKIDGVEAGADVTDTANVTAAGALMDSELTSEASVKALDQGVATTDSPSFAGLTVDTTTFKVDAANNRVGIGTTSPSSTLDVVGDAEITGNLTVDTDTLYVDATNNRVGIGDTSPVARMQVSRLGGAVSSTPSLHGNTTVVVSSGNGTTAAGAYLAFLGGNGASGGVTFSDTDAAEIGALFYFHTDDSMRFTTNGTASSERMRIDSSGRVGIGTPTPTEALDVNSDAIRIRTAQTPASASATGTTGQICWSSNYVYVCVATNTWKRAALSTW